MSTKAGSDGLTAGTLQSTGQAIPLCYCISIMFGSDNANINVMNECRNGMIRS